MFGRKPAGKKLEQRQLAGVDLAEFVPEPGDLLGIVYVSGAKNGKSACFCVGEQSEILDSGVFGVRLHPAGDGFPLPLWVKVSAPNMITKTDHAGSCLGTSYRVTSIAKFAGATK